MARFERWLEPQLAQDEALASMGGWASKLAGAAARLAGILHAATVQETRKGSTNIDVSTVKRAIKLGRRLLPHARGSRVRADGANPLVKDAERVIR